MLLTIFCMLCTLHLSGSFQSTRKDKHTIVVLVGATGDLSSKYLWQSMFNVYRKSLDDINATDKNGASRFANQSFTFIGAARNSEESGMVVVNNIISKIECPNFSKDAKTKTDEIARTSCEKQKETFTTYVNYQKLTEPEEFRKLCSHVALKFMNVEDQSKELVIYLAISASAYESVIYNFQRVCYHQLRELKINVKWSLEKPFGKDKRSAELLSEKVLKYIKEKDVYRVDHYLAKSLVKTILPFRYVGYFNSYINRLYCYYF